MSHLDKEFAKIKKAQKKAKRYYENFTAGMFVPTVVISKPKKP